MESSFIASLAGTTLMSSRKLSTYYLVPAVARAKPESAVRSKAEIFTVISGADCPGKIKNDWSLGFRHWTFFLDWPLGFHH
jgi:hypothetical protein